MIKRLIYILFLIIATRITVFGQFLPVYSQYLVNSFLMNPAVAGSESVTALRLTNHNQWTGINNAPRTQVLSVHTRIQKQGFYDKRGRITQKTQFDSKGNIVRTQRLGSSGKVGLGAFVFHDKTGPVSRTGMSFSYAYHIPFSSDKFIKQFMLPPQLSFGISGNLFQHKINSDELVFIDSDDPVLSESKLTAFTPDINFGLMLYMPDFFIGASIAQLFESKLKLNHSVEDNLLSRNYFIHGGFRINYQHGAIEPSILAKKASVTDIQFDYNCRLFIKNISLAISYRSNNDIVFMFDIHYNHFYFGYSYDYSISSVMKYTTGSHEFVLGVNLPNVSKQ